MRLPSGREWALRLTLLVSSLIACVILGEILLGRILPPEAFITWQERVPRGFMANPGGTSVLHEARDRRIEYRFNDLRLRGDPVPPEGRRVLFVGDSFLFGWLLPEGDTPVDRLQESADAAFGEGVFHLLNGGAANWGASDYLAFVEEYGENIRPDVVVVLLNCFDAGRSDDGLWTMEADSLVPRVPEVRKEGPIDRTLGRIPGYDWLRRNSHLYRAARTALNRLGYHIRQEGEVPRTVAEEYAGRTTELARAIYRRLHAWSETRGVRLVVLTSGFIDHCYVEGVPSDATIDADRRFLASADSFFSAEGIPYHDITGAVEADAEGRWESLRIPSDGHPNEAGARAIARAAWPRLEPYLASELAGAR